MTTSLPLTPFRRAASDFATASGAELARDKITQILMTEPGELAWDPTFGVGLEGLLHRSNDNTTAALARVRASRALALHLPPEVAIVTLETSRKGTTLSIAVRFRINGEQGDALVELRASSGVS